MALCLVSCPQCQAQVDASSKYCQECGLRLGAHLPRLSCPYCSAEYKVDSNICGTCGRTLQTVNVALTRQACSDATANPAPQPATSVQYAKPFINVLLAVATATYCGILIAWLSQTNTFKQKTVLHVVPPAATIPVAANRASAATRTAPALEHKTTTSAAAIAQPVPEAKDTNTQQSHNRAVAKLPPQESTQTITSPQPSLPSARNNNQALHKVTAQTTKRSSGTLFIGRQTDEPSEVSASTSAPAPAKSTPSSDRDLVLYNKLLANFFSDPHQAKENKSSGLKIDGVDITDTQDTTTSGPPSFREWLDQGKPTF